MAALNQKKSTGTKQIEIDELILEIAKNSDYFGCLFTSPYDFFPEEYANQETEILFLGRLNKLNYWNATIETIRNAQKVKIFRTASKDILDQMTPEQRSESFKITFGNKDAALARQPALPQFDNKTYRKVFSEHIKELEKKPPEIFESYQIIDGYTRGTGLHMIVDQPYLTRENIESTIKHFYEIGETNWISTVSPSNVFIPSL